MEGNHFEGNSDQAICMLNTYQEYNGILYNLIIRKNVFKLISGWPVRTATTTQHALNRNRNIFGVVTASVNWPVGDSGALKRQGCGRCGIFGSKTTSL